MDEIDRANELVEVFIANAIRENSKPLEKGVEGDCDLCGEWSGRLIAGACAPCRDKYRLK